MSVRRRDVTPADQLELVELPEGFKRRPWIAYAIFAVLVAALIAAGYGIGQAVQAPQPAALANCITSTQTGPHTFIGRQPMCILPHHKYTASVDTTQGKIVIELLPDYAPSTVNNFIVLATHGYYNNLSWWKSENWLIQGGDPKNNGTGGPGYNLADEDTSFLKWDLGAVGMSRVPGGAINGSQFFILKAPWPGSGPTAVYNRFGTVVGGLDKAQLLTPVDSITSISIAVT
jgi:cyclophilin family peptidyl-prolyl cis-trans isomerase